MQQHVKIIECETGPPCLEKHQIAFEGSQVLAAQLAGVLGGGGAQEAENSCFQDSPFMSSTFQGQNSSTPFLRRGRLEATYLSLSMQRACARNSGIWSGGVRGGGTLSVEDDGRCRWWLAVAPKGGGSLWRLGYLVSLDCSSFSADRSCASIGGQQLCLRSGTQMCKSTAHEETGSVHSLGTINTRG